MTLDKNDYFIDLSMNENHSLDHIDTLVSPQEQFEYPRYADDLKRIIADKHSIPTHSVFLCNGIDSAIWLFCLWLKIQNGCLLYDVPNYFGIIDSINALGVSAIAYKQGLYGFKKDYLYNELTNRRINALYICNPRNPIGDIIDNLEELLKNERVQECAVFLDEAYAEFVYEDPDRIRRLIQNPSIIIARTFSKAYALAGIRCGYIITENAGFQAFLKKIEYAQPYRNSIYALKTALVAIQDNNRITSGFADISNNKDKICKLMNTLKIKYYPSKTNFISFEVEDPQDLLAYMFQHKILIANLDKFRMPNCVRVTVGNKCETEAFLKILEQYYRREI